MITTAVLRARVRRGMDWLKTDGPQYNADITRINWSRLNLRNNRFCVLGQAVPVPAGALSSGYCEVFLQVSGEFFCNAGPGAKGDCDRLAQRWMYAKGFDLNSHIEENFGTWSRLRDAWIEAAIEDGLHAATGGH